MFRYDPSKFNTQLESEGYVHLTEILDEPFVNYLKEFYSTSMESARNESEEWRVKGKKRQFVFDFPSKNDEIAFRDGLAALLGLDPAKITISERHLKVYDEHANPWPIPHKDRAASFYSIGLPVHLSEGSSVCVMPGMDTSPNPNEHAIFLDEVEEVDPDEIYKDPNVVLLNEDVGDVVVFKGSSLYHERVNAAHTAVLYIKLNGTGEDPLGENLYG